MQDLKLSRAEGWLPAALFSYLYAVMVTMWGCPVCAAAWACFLVACGRCQIDGGCRRLRQGNVGNVLFCRRESSSRLWGFLHGAPMISLNYYFWWVQLQETELVLNGYLILIEDLLCKRDEESSEGSDNFEFHNLSSHTLHLSPAAVAPRLRCILPSDSFLINLCLLLNNYSHL